MTETYHTKKSAELFERACRIIPGGVNSPVRAFQNVDSLPPFFKRARGSKLYDVDNNEYVDYVCSWGAVIIGHAQTEVIEAISATAKKGTSFGAPTELEIKLAEQICNNMPTVESVRMVNSGTEAAMSAIRLARAYTKRDKIIKFDGCYHGHSDSLLAGAGSGVSTLGIPGSPGVPAATVGDTLVLEYNNSEQLEEVVKHHAQDIACVIIEPIAGNMNLVPADLSFIQKLRELCTINDIVLIFDEVMSGFRVALGGAQSVLNINPDLTILGKVIGGGLPVGAFGGKREIMQMLAPSGPVYQAGTLSGNPIAMVAGLKTLELIQAPNFFTELANKSKQLCDGLQTLATNAQIPFHAVACGGMFGLFFIDQAIKTLRQAQQTDEEAFKLFHRGMLKQGFYFAPSRFEAAFISSAHSGKNIADTLSAAEVIFSEIKRKRY